MKKDENTANIKNVFKNTDENTLSKLMENKLINIICLAESTETTVYKRSQSKVQ